MLLKSKIEMAGCTYFEYFIVLAQQNLYVSAPVRPINIHIQIMDSDWAVFVEDNDNNRGQKYPL